MQATIIMTAATLLGTASLLAGCNGGDSPVAAVPATAVNVPAQIKEETPAQILVMAQTTSEVNEPLLVAPDAIASADVDDSTSSPIPVI
jgi:hypothetical protein